MRFPGISAKLVRICEITGIFHRCNIFLKNIEKFCKQSWRYEGNAADFDVVSCWLITPCGGANLIIMRDVSFDLAAVRRGL